VDVKTLNKSSLNSSKELFPTQIRHEHGNIAETPANAMEWDLLQYCNMVIAKNKQLSLQEMCYNNI